MPLLQELALVGGSDEVRYLWPRLLRYFPQLVSDDAAAMPGCRARLLRAVQRAARNLVQSGEVEKIGQHLRLTDKGRRRLLAEQMETSNAAEALLPQTDVCDERHRQAQHMLLEIGRILGCFAQMEHEHYDVVWRKNPRAPRLSHVFEVQVRGSVDGALMRLKQADETQGARLYLVVSDERSAAFAEKRLARAFPEISPRVHLLGLGEIQKLHGALVSQGRLLDLLKSA